MLCKYGWYVLGLTLVSTEHSERVEKISMYTKTIELVYVEIFLNNIFA